jgi:ArsR family transcriptional regulator, arsenate/arsenite/antimonite-responsive transcriptional repressor
MTLEQFIKITKALSDPQRVRALLSLRKGELCVCQIIELLSLAPSTISKHMSILKQAGLVSSRKDSRWVYYRLTDADKCDKNIVSIIDLSLSILEQDKEISKDDAALLGITCETIESLCKRQKKLEVIHNANT